MRHLIVIGALLAFTTLQAGATSGGRVGAAPPPAPAIGLGPLLAGRTLVVPSSREPIEQDELRHDLRVFARVVKKLADPEGRWGSHDAAGRLYLDGHGVVITMAAAYPLAPDVLATDVGDAWAQASRDLAAGGLRRSVRAAYDPGNVTALTRRITDGMPYAANIRGLPDRGFVRVVVAEHERRGTRANPEWWWPEVWVSAHRAQMGAPLEQSRLVLTADVADVRDAASGAIAADAFRERVRVTTHSADGPPDTSRPDLDPLETAFSQDLARQEELGESAVEWVRATHIEGHGVLLFAQTRAIVAWPQGPDAPGMSDPVDILWERERASASVGKSVMSGDPLAAVVEAALDLFGDAGATRHVVGDPSVTVVVRGRPAPDWAVPVRTLVTIHAETRDVEAHAAGSITRQALRKRMKTTATVVPVSEDYSAWRPIARGQQ